MNRHVEVYSLWLEENQTQEYKVGWHKPCLSPRSTRFHGLQFHRLSQLWWGWHYILHHIQVHFQWFTNRSLLNQWMLHLWSLWLQNWLDLKFLNNRHQEHLLWNTWGYQEDLVPSSLHTQMAISRLQMSLYLDFERRSRFYPSRIYMRQPIWLMLRKSCCSLLVLLKSSCFQKMWQKQGHTYKLKFYYNYWTQGSQSKLNSRGCRIKGTQHSQLLQFFYLRQAPCQYLPYWFQIQQTHHTC